MVFLLPSPLLRRPLKPLGVRVEHHSRVLMENKRYSRCFTYASDDHAHWAQGICDAGYAYRPSDDPNRYANAIEKIIKSNDLGRYDQMAIADAADRGIQIGYMRDNPGDFQVSFAQEGQASRYKQGNYSYPLDGEIVLTESFGVDPTSYRNHTHNGIDLRANYADVFATEDEGKVVGVGSDNLSGKYVIVAYDRPDGSQWRVSYCHLSEQLVSKGDPVTAGMKIGVSGSTGNSTAPHLHLTVKHKDAGQSSFEAVDPLNYLAEIAVMGGLEGTVTKKGTGEDLLAEKKENIHTEVIARQENEAIAESARSSAEEVKDDENLLASLSKSSDPKDWLAMLMMNNGESNMAQGDFLNNLVSTLFMGVIALAMQLDHGESVGQKDGREVIPALSDSPADQQTVIDRRRNGVDVNALRQEVAMNYDIDYPEEQQTNSVRLA